MSAEVVVGFPDEGETMLAAALRYAQRGWPVFPVHSIRVDHCTCGNVACLKRAKHPRTPNGHLDATSDRGQIEKWWGKWPDANIGHPPAEDEVVLDVDPRNGGDDSLADLAERYGAINTRECLTGGGGRQLYLGLPLGVSVSTNRIDGYPGIDVKTHTGYVILPPSVHASGRRYAWELSSPEEPAEAPRWLVEILTCLPAPGNPRSSGGTTVREGRRNSTVAREAGKMRRIGMSESQIVPALHVYNREHCEPPLGDREVDAIAHSVSKYESAPRPEPRATWKVESARAIVARGVPPLEWDVLELLPRDDGPALFFAPPGNLKSWLMLHLCVCMGTGARFLGHFPVHRREWVIYVNLDSGKRAFERRLMRVNPPENLLVISPTLYDPDEFTELLREHPHAFVAVDCLADVGGEVPLRGEDAAHAARRYFRELRLLYEQHGANGVITDHPHRPRDGFADYYGSSQKEAALRVMWTATPSGGDDGSKRVKIVCRKMNEAEIFKPFEVSVDFRDELVRFGFEGYLNDTTGARTDGPSDTDRIANILRDVPGGMSCKGIMDRTGLPRDRAREALKERRFHSVGKGKATRYVLRESNAPPGDSTLDSENGYSESNESNETLGALRIQGDSNPATSAQQSNGAPADSALFTDGTDNGLPPAADSDDGLGVGEPRRGRDDEREEIDPDALFQYASERIVEKPVNREGPVQSELFDCNHGEHERPS